MPFHQRYRSIARSPATTLLRVVRDSKIVGRDKAATAAVAISAGAEGAAGIIAVAAEGAEANADSAVTFHLRNMLYHDLWKKLPASLPPRKGTCRLFCPGSPWQSIATGLP